MFMHEKKYVKKLRLCYAHTNDNSVYTQKKYVWKNDMREKWYVWKMICVKNDMREK